ncbi:uncharacterized protein PSANT_02665 [Moesziomyces antarcticus]|uniref:Uncharacterized protein n=1 Tax=Pseudozyma antarctica TaxID=84753 RepID=A0A5C3FNK7_PSEA2|nr:uncharacterized protein PSANT_02665 [Moesziomyces antarcticus]
MCTTGLARGSVRMTASCIDAAARLDQPQPGKWGAGQEPQAAGPERKRERQSVPRVHATGPPPSFESCSVPIASTDPGSLSGFAIHHDSRARASASATAPPLQIRKGAKASLATALLQHAHSRPELELPA